MLHLIKLSVGSASFQDMDDWQRKRQFRHSSGVMAGIHGTTMRPKREGEILNGGSIYWVVKGFIIARNTMAAIEFDPKKQGRARCSLVYKLPLIPVVPRRFRAFQGWRYFRAEDAPPDMARTDFKNGVLPSDLMEELADLGLL